MNLLDSIVVDQNGGGFALLFWSGSFAGTDERTIASTTALLDDWSSDSSGKSIICLSYSPTLLYSFNPQFYTVDGNVITVNVDGKNDFFVTPGLTSEWAATCTALPCSLPVLKACFPFTKSPHQSSVPVILSGQESIGDSTSLYDSHFYGQVNDLTIYSCNEQQRDENGRKEEEKKEAGDSGCKRKKKGPLPKKERAMIGVGVVGGILALSGGAYWYRKSNSQQQLIAQQSSHHDSSEDKLVGMVRMNKV